MQEFAWFEQPVLNPGTRQATAQLHLANQFTWKFAQTSFDDYRLCNAAHPVLMYQANGASTPAYPPSIADSTGHLKDMDPAIYVPKRVLDSHIAEAAALPAQHRPVCKPSVSVFRCGQDQPTSWLASFAAGTNASQLGVGLYIQTSDKALQCQVRLDVAEYVHPIAQLATSSLASELVLVTARNTPTTSLSLLSVGDGANPSASSIGLQRIRTFDSLATGQRRQLDFCLHPASTEVLMSNTLGAVYAGRTEQGNVEPRLTATAAEGYLDATDPFCKVAYGSRAPLSLAAFKHDVLLLDSRSPPHKAQRLFHIPDAKTRRPAILDVLQSMRPFSEHKRHPCILTSDRLAWVDDRMPDRALLSWEHYRADADLVISEVVATDETCQRIALTSRNNDVKTVYSIVDGVAPQSVASPYSLLQNGAKGSAGVASVNLADTPDQPTLFLEVDPTGSVFHSIYSLGEDERWEIHGNQAVGDQGAPEVEAPVRLPRKHYKSMRAAYEGMFNPKVGSADHVSLLGFQQIEGMAENLAEAPHLATPVELLAQAHPFYAEFTEKWTLALVSAAMNAYQMPLHLIAEGLQQSELWGKAALQLQHDSVRVKNGPVLPTGSSGAQELIPLSKKLSDTYAKSSSNIRQKLACDQVALDLFLSSRALQPRPFVPIKDEHTDPYRTPKGKQVVGSFREVREPPPIAFPFYGLKGDAVASKSARVLLGEWELGADPFQITFEEQFQDGAGRTRPEPVPPSRAPSASQPPLRVPTFSQFSQQPVYSQQPVAVQRRPAASQGEEGIPATQVLPGRHGGRSHKPARRKRADGF